MTATKIRVIFKPTNKNLFFCTPLVTQSPVLLVPFVPKVPQVPPIQNSKFPHPPCATHFGKLSKSAKVFLPHTSYKSHTSHKSQKSHQFKILLTEPSAKDERRMSEGLAKDNALPPLARACSSCPIHNSQFIIPPSPQFKILLKALIIKHYFVPLPPAKAVIVFGTIYAILLWQALCPKESAAQVIFIKHTF